MASLTLSLAEFIFLMLCGVIVGIVVYYIIASRKSFRETVKGQDTKPGKELESWKLKYFNDIELRDRELEQLRHKLSENEENNQINTIEAEELRKKNKKLIAEMETLRNATPASGDSVKSEEVTKLRDRLMKAEENVIAYQMESSELKKQLHKLQEEIESLRNPDVSDAGNKPDYIEKLTQAQLSLMDHNQKISQLLGQIELVKATEEKQQEVLKLNEELSDQVNGLKQMLSDKDKEIDNIRQKANLTKEMTSMLDNAYSEFNILQDKIHKLESQVAASKKISLEYEDIREDYYKVTRELDETRIRYDAIVVEKLELQRVLSESEEKLRDMGFQRQQLQKRVAYLEELNSDIQSVSDTNKKLETQLKRLGELESMLNVVAEERDELAKKQGKNG